MTLAEWDDAMETLLFDRPDEPFGVRVEIGTLRRQLDGLAWSGFRVRRCAALVDGKAGPRVQGSAPARRIGTSEPDDRYAVVPGIQMESSDAREFPQPLV